MNRLRWLLLLLVLAVAAVPLLLSLGDVGGGSTFDSPDGKYRLSTWSSLSGNPGDSYTVELFQINPLRKLRSVTVYVATDERTPAMRGGSKVQWDMTGRTVDLLVHDRPEIRLYLPVDQ